MRKSCLIILIVLILPLLLSACAKQPRAQFWGSFTPEKTYSYDRRYYALQTVADQMMVITVYDAESGLALDAFSPARSADFWGVCWEKDALRLWMQSADIGTFCYSYQDGKWVLDDRAVLPDYIISRYDPAYRDHPELWESIYRSPME